MAKWNGKAIKALRGDSSQAVFAEHFGVDQSTVSLWEQGKIKPRGPVLKLLDALAASQPREAA